MSPRPHRIDKNNLERRENVEIACGRPLIHILDDDQWLLIRRQFRMSPREMEVAKFVCSGLSNEEIARQLKIKSATVKTHLRNVYRRINVQRKLDMLLKFIDHSTRYFGSKADVRMSVFDANNSLKSAFGSDIAGKDQVTGQ